MNEIVIYSSLLFIVLHMIFFHLTNRLLNIITFLGMAVGICICLSNKGYITIIEGIVSLGVAVILTILFMPVINQYDIGFGLIKLLYALCFFFGRYTLVTLLFTIFFTLQKVWFVKNSEDDETIIPIMPYVFLATLATIVLMNLIHNEVIPDFLSIFDHISSYSSLLQ